MWLTKALATILREMRDAEDRGDSDAAELVCGSECWLGDRRVHRGSVDRLLTLTAISDRSDEGAALERYCINEMGRAILRRPDIIQEYTAALRAGGSYTIRDDRLVMI